MESTSHGGYRRGVNQSKIQNKKRNSKQKRNGLKMVADSTYGLYGQGQMVARAEETRDSIYFEISIFSFRAAISKTGRTRQPAGRT